MALRALLLITTLSSVAAFPRGVGPRALEPPPGGGQSSPPPLSGSTRGVRPLRAKSIRMRRGELESRILILVTLALVAFGIVMVYSATSAAAAVGGRTRTTTSSARACTRALGIVLMVIAQRWDYRRLRRSRPRSSSSRSALLAAVLVIGPAINGARRWISVGPAVFQPSELAKLVARRLGRGLSLAAAPAADAAQLWRPDRRARRRLRPAPARSSPTSARRSRCSLMLAAMLARRGHAGAGTRAAVGIAGALGTLAIWFEPYRRARFFSFLHPWHDAQGTGFQIVQAMIGMGSGGVFGVGLGKGVAKLFYLPEAPTDMMLANIGEELGLVGVSASSSPTWSSHRPGSGSRSAAATRSESGLRSGLTMLVCGQAAVNMAAVMGIAPLTGIPLPFLSYGGSSLVVLLAAVGILLNIALVATQRQLRCVIAAGGTAGHVLPALAVADALRERGVLRDVRRVAGSRRGAARP